MTQPPADDRRVEAERRVNDPKWLLTQITDRMKICPIPDAQLRLTAHVRERTGHNSLVAFYNNGSTPELKLEILKELFRALLKGDFSELKGQVPAGQAATPAKPEEPVQEAPGIPKKLPAVEFGIPPEPEAPQPSPGVSHTVKAAKGSPQGKPAGRAAALEALAELLNAPQQVQIDPDEVRAIATEIVESHLKERLVDARNDLAERLNAFTTTAQKRVDDYLAKIPPRDVIELRKWDGTVKELSGLRHKQLPTVIKSVTARNRSGWPVPCWWYGAPGAGKTHLFKQVAEALDATFYPIPMGPTTTEGKLLGYNNLATGSFVKGQLYEPYKNGGFVLIDEIDIADPSVLVGANSISSNDEFMFPNGEVVPRHRDFYLVASANTLGTGSIGGFTRNKLDAATLDRFAKFRLEYDAELESTLCGNAKWAEWVYKVRQYVEANCSQSIYITPRASINGAALLANGLSAAEVVEATVLAMMPKDLKQTVITQVGLFVP